MASKIDKKTGQQVTEKEENALKREFAFGKLNYILLVVGIILIAIGLLLMTGGGSDDPNIFNEKMFNTRRLTIAPMMILLGFAVEIVAIMIKRK